METLAYLHLTEEYENSDARELNVSDLTKKAAIGALGVACAVGVVSIADSASAYGGGYYGGYRCYTHCYTYYSYYPRYHHYPRYYSYNPCRW